MVKYSDDLDGVFRALSDGTRRALVGRLARGPASVSDLAEPFDMVMPAVMKHLGVLEDGGIVTSAKVGRVRTYQLVPDAFRPGIAWMVDHRAPGEKQMDRLSQFLTESTKGESND